MGWAADIERRVTDLEKVHEEALTDQREKVHDSCTACQCTIYRLPGAIVASKTINGAKLTVRLDIDRPSICDSCIVQLLRKGVYSFHD